MDALLKGFDYTELPDTYVIFICDYDPVGDELYRYTIMNRCEENGKHISDGNHTIWLSTKGKNASDEPKELVDFLKYVENPEESEDTEDNFIKSLKEQIAAIKRNRDWEARFMLFEEMMQDEREAGRAEGRKEGRLEGEEATFERLNRLVQLLAKQKRTDDIVKAASDREYQKQLLKEFNL